MTRLRSSLVAVVGLSFALVTAGAASARAQEKAARSVDEGAPKASASQDAFARCKKLGRGVNVLGYDPVWRSPERGRLKPRHFALLRAAGFDSVRINLHPFRHARQEPGHPLPDSWFAVLDGAIEVALANGLQVVLDLHEFQALGKDPARHREIFLDVWRQLAVRYRDAPEEVLFEILNEPSKELTPTSWNRYLREALAIIRESNPRRTVIIGPAFWNSIAHLDELELPEDDRNLIVTVHYYTPMDFTHQGASWADRADELGVEWRGTPEEREAIRRDFARADAWSQANRRPIFLGEFGAYDKAPMDSRVRYLSAVARTAESFGWSWAYWQLDSDFILYDIDRDRWVEPIRDALVPPKP